jgi:gliding motility-associated-like protein
MRHIVSFWMGLWAICFAWAGSVDVHAQQQPKPFDYGNTCLNECARGDSAAATYFEDTLANVKAWRWNFDDPASGAKNTGNTRRIRHLYTTPGVKNVKLVRTFNNNSKDSVTVAVTINPPPQPFFLGNNPSQTDTTICKGDSIQLDPYKGGAPSTTFKYLWFPKGDTTQASWAAKSGCYSVEVTDTLTGCVAQNRLNVKICIEQNQESAATKWYFGNNAGISFPQGGGQPQIETDGQVNTKEGAAYVNDSRGNLLFYTDGRFIYDRQGRPIQSPKDTQVPLAGSETSTQSATIVPVPSCQGCQSVYYVFTTTEINGNRTLSYSIVDMRKNKGQGAIVKKNTPLQVGTTERLKTVLNPSDSSFWVISHDYGNNAFRLYRVTKSGLTEPKIIRVGAPHDSLAKGKGYLQVSPDGRRLAVAIPGGAKNIIQVFNFNDSTGNISQPITLDLGPVPPSLYGIEFSPNGEKLYATVRGDSAQGIESRLFQFDITKTDSLSIQRTKVTLDSSKTTMFGALQLGPDDRIYMANENRNFLSIIEKPNFSKDSVSYQTGSAGFNLGNKKVQLGLPMGITPPSQDDNSGVGIMASDTCFGTPTTFQAGPLCDPLKDLVNLWDFGDGRTAQGTPGQPITHQYQRPGTYQVKLQIVNECKDTVITRQVTIKPQPQLDLGQDRNVCGSSTQLQNQSSNNPPNTQYQWFLDRQLLPRQNQPTLTAQRSGSYILVARTDGCLAVDSVRIALLAANAFDIGRDTTLCQGRTLVLDAKATNATYRWSTGATTRQITVTSSGQYSVRVTDNVNNCSAEDAINVIIRPKPTFSISVQNASLCNSNDGGISILNLSPSSANFNFKWFKSLNELAGVIGSNATGLGAGQYSVEIKSVATCDTTVSIPVNATGSPLRLSYNISNADCQSPSGGVIRLTTLQGTPRSYEITNDITHTAPGGGPFLSEIRGLKPGQYSISVKDANGCSWVAGGIMIGLESAKLSRLPRDTSRCQGELITLNAVFRGDSYLWSTGAVTSQITVSTAGQYRVEVSDSRTQCTTVYNVNVRFSPKPNVLAGPPVSVCANSPTFLLTGNSPANGRWSGPGVSPIGLFTPSALQAGTRIVRYEVTSGGCTGFADKAVNVQLPLDIDLGPDRALCDNANQAVLSVPELSNTTYRWSNGATSSSINPLSDGRYFVAVSQGRCVSTDTVNIRLLSTPRISLRSQVSLCVPEGNGTILAPVGQNSADLTYLWSPIPATTRTLNVTTPGRYSLVVRNVAGCFAQQNTEVVDICDPRVFVPDVFSPNSDGANDLLDVFTAHLVEPELRIFNRWGEVMFVTKDLNQRWDGTYKGALCTNDTYAWTLSYRATYYPERGVLFKRGAVLLAK